MAVKFLKKHGHRILARNFWTDLGEIDIVALEKRTGTLCFIEVRSRSAGKRGFFEPASSVNRMKQRKIVRAAQIYIKKKRASGRSVRFDVIGITFPAADDGKPEIRHIPAAFNV